MFLDLLTLPHMASWRRELGCLLCLSTDRWDVCDVTVPLPPSPTSHVVTIMWTLLPLRAWRHLWTTPKQSSYAYQWHDHKGVGGIEWQGKKILSLWLTPALQSGQTSSRAEQSEQHITCPHGTNATSTSASVQIWQRRESLHFTSDSWTSCKYIAHITTRPSDMWPEFSKVVRLPTDRCKLSSMGVP